MKIDVVSIFPDMFAPFLAAGVIGKALERELAQVRAHDLREFTDKRHRQVDDEPYGGGPGMVMAVEPFYNALCSILQSDPWVLPGGTRTILLSPSGLSFDHALAHDLSEAEHLVLLCGRYEGIDARVSAMVTDEVSIGDFVLSGGELAAMVVIDAVLRQVGGVLGAEESLNEESFRGGTLEYPQYTRPAVWRGIGVPAVLTSGDHERVRGWRREQARFLTEARRPDLR